ncbi:hypothetical protein MA03_07865 [Infirmifilum uzonense]|uniref:CDP-archaeol synthase n=1 Tax=Infirmifilum uzonense TaxID=1550241 RepID=A0A0F7FJG1_9CREN|nr:CDP-2,3-bis-(O-geranylgeranyl)-sn-glycerol synthase [Infirmifilum uzonense]AKG39165.1 hypothetical protein MA03_07865 [Infirmifilum uzonense]
MSVQDTVIGAILWILPAYVANAAPVPTVYFLRKLGGKTHPLDLGLNFIDGKRVLGDNKTLEGFIGGLSAGSLVGAGLQLWGLHSFPLALILSFGALAGDLAGAFVKRRLGLKPGDPAPLLDQLDFVLGATILYQLFAPVRLEYFLIVVIMTPLLHLATNTLAYLLGLKSNPW